jgi:hypothetical protein
MKSSKESEKQPNKNNLNLEKETKQFPSSQFSKASKKDAEKALGDRKENNDEEPHQEHVK